MVRRFMSSAGPYLGRIRKETVHAGTEGLGHELANRKEFIDGLEAQYGPGYVAEARAALLTRNLGTIDAALRDLGF